MSKTNVTLQEVQQFNTKIKDFSKNLKNCFELTDSALKSLGHKWQDEQYKTFKANFEKHSKQLAPLSQELDKYKTHVETYWEPKIKKIIDQYNQGKG